MWKNSIIRDHKKTPSDIYAQKYLNLRFSI